MRRADRGSPGRPELKCEAEGKEQERNSADTNVALLRLRNFFRLAGGLCLFFRWNIQQE